MLEMSYMHCMQLLIFSRRGVGGGGGGGIQSSKSLAKGLIFTCMILYTKCFDMQRLPRLVEGYNYTGLGLRFA